MLRKKLAAPAAAIVVLSGVAGFGRHTGPAQASRSSESYSGTISISDYQVPDALGGGTFGQAAVDQELAAMTEDNLVTFDQHANFLPDFVTEIPSTKNGGIKTVGGNEVVTWHLKPNLKWSDGSPITHADFVAGFLIDFSPDISIVDPTNKIQSETFSGNDLIMTFKGIYAPAVQQFGIGQPSVVTPWEYMQKKYGASVSGFDTSSWNYAKVVDAKTGLIPAGTYASSGLKKFIAAYNGDHYTSPNDIHSGPYKLAEWSPDQRYVLVPNTFYNALPADPKHPRPAKIQFVVLSEDGTTFIQSMSSSSTYNTIDKAEDFALTDLKTLKQSKYQVLVPGALYYELLDLQVGPTFRGKPNPLHDARIRQALQYAINKTQYIKALFPDVDPNSVILSSLVPSASSWSYNSHLPQNPYNLAKARALIQAAGYDATPGFGGKHLQLDFVTTNSGFRIRSGQLFQRIFAQIGINLKIRYAKARGAPNSLFGTYQDGGIQATHDFQISEHAFQENPDPDEGYLNIAKDQISSAQNPTGANVDALDDPKLEDLYLKGRNTVDEAARHNYYNQAQQYFFDQAYNISLFNRPNIVVVKGTIGNFKANPTQQGYEWNAWEWFFDGSNSQKALNS